MPVPSSPRKSLPRDKGHWSLMWILYQPSSSPCSPHLNNPLHLNLNCQSPFLFNLLYCSNHSEKCWQKRVCFFFNFTYLFIFRSAGSLLLRVFL